MCCAVLSHSVQFDSLWPHGLYPARLLSPWGLSRQNTRVSYHALKGIFSIQGSNTGFPHCRQILYHLSHQGSPWILEWVAYPFSRRSSLPRNWTGVSCMAGGFFTSWATRDALTYVYIHVLKSKDITVPTKVCIVKAKVFPGATYGCKSWTIKKAECWRADAFNL